MQFIYLSICPSVYLSVYHCLSCICLSIYLSVYVDTCLYRVRLILKLLRYTSALFFVCACIRAEIPFREMAGSC